MTDSYNFSFCVRVSTENCRLVLTCVAFLLRVGPVMLTEVQAGTAPGQAVDGTNVQQLQCAQKQSQGKKKPKNFTLQSLLPVLLFDLI